MLYRGDYPLNSLLNRFLATLLLLDDRGILPMPVV